MIKLRSALPFARKRRERLQLAIITNQLATPGLGSWIAGHKIAGAGQLILACSGFTLYLIYFMRLIVGTWNATWNGIEPDQLPSWLWERALLIFAISWVWSAVTSLQIYGEMRRLKPESVEPPRLDPA